MRAGVALGGRSVEIAVEGPAVVHTRGEFAGNVDLALGFGQRLSGRDRRSLRSLLRLRVPGDHEPQALRGYLDTEHGMEVVFHSPSLVGAEVPASLELRWGPAGENGLGSVACLAADSLPGDGAGRVWGPEGDVTTIDPRPVTPSGGCLGALLLLAAALGTTACTLLGPLLASS